MVGAAKVIKEKGYKNIVIQLVGQVYQQNSNTVSETYLKKVHDEGYVDWLGLQTDINHIYQNTDIAVLPSYYREGLPKSLLEAAACGLPIITTDTPGCREICVHEENGLLVKTKDSEGLANAIIKLSKDKELRDKMGKASRFMVEEKFSLTCINGEMWSIISGSHNINNNSII